MMPVTTKDGILKVLRGFNPWWVSGTVSPVFQKNYKRFAYYEAMKRMQGGIRRMVVITGARRVGKTTIEYQMINSLLEQGVPAQQIVFISLDHPMLKLAGMDDILECYHENVYAGQDVYYFFDEIQYATDWASWLKTIMTHSRKQAWWPPVRQSSAGSWQYGEWGGKMDGYPSTDAILL